MPRTGNSLFGLIHRLNNMSIFSTGNEGAGRERATGMDVIRLISELRSELAQMEREIRFLERFDAATTQAVAQLVAETGWVRDLDEMLVN